MWHVRLQASGEAALEWFLAVCFLAYIGSIILDVYPSRYTSRHTTHPTNPALGQMISNQTDGANGIEMGGANGAGLGNKVAPPAPAPVHDMYAPTDRTQNGSVV